MIMVIIVVVGFVSYVCGELIRLMDFSVVFSML